MSKINYQALREAAQLATQGEWVAFISTDTGTYAVHTPGDERCEDVIKWTGFDGQKNAENNARYIAAFNPEVVQALLDERERNQQYIKSRDQENEMMVDAMHAAIALTSVGIDLDDYDECVLRLHEWGALPDYCIALYVDFVHGIVSKNKLLDFGYINGAPVWTLRDELEAAKSKLNEQREYYEGVISDGSKRIAELKAEPVSQTYKLNQLSGNSPVTPDGWISCSERTPNDAQWCVVNTKYGYYVQCWSEGQGWLGDDISIPECDVINWMPLPEPPQEVNRG
ncbi:TPA: ead/Ea22-like family protein [Escherichia coli]|nr:ead/Ea22-like family protein [Escherichia coli]